MGSNREKNPWNQCTKNKEMKSLNFSYRNIESAINKWIAKMDKFIGISHYGCTNNIFENSSHPIVRVH